MKRNEVILSEVCDILNGYAFDSSLFSSTEGLPLIRIRDMKNSNCSMRFTGEFDEKYLIKEGDLLIGMDGEFDIYEWHGDPSLLNQRVCKLIPKRNVLDKHYLLHRLKADLKEIERNTSSTTVKHISSTQIMNIKWQYLPSYEEQKDIGISTQNELTEIKKAREATEVQIAEISNLANAIIFDSLNNSETVNYSLGDVLDEVKNGIGSAWKSYPVYGATRKGIALAKEPPGKTPQRYKPIVPGTVFYNPMRILIGSIAFAEDDVENGITSPDYVVLKGKKGLVNSRWFYYWLRSPLGQQCITSLARGAVRERMLFNRLAEGTIDLPAIAEQEKAAEILKSLKQMQTVFYKQMQDITELPNKILAHAFNGIENG